jgi:hypothetical protein
MHQVQTGVFSMKNQYRSKVTMAWMVSLLAIGSQAGTAVKPEDTPKPGQVVTKQASSASVQGKAGRLLSGTVAYGTHHWSFAKVDWMEPIWQGQGKQLYTSLDYMNHLNKSNNHSHEIGSGLVWWQSLASERELGLGAYWLNYNSWHNLRHHALRLGAKLIWQAWQVTGNGFFRLSKEKPGKPLQQHHPYFGDGLLGSERVLNGVDMILDKPVGALEWQAFAYHYPRRSQQTSQLLSTGLGLAVQTLISPLSTTTFHTHAKLKATYDKHKHQLLLVSLQTSIPNNHRYQIHKTDTDGNSHTLSPVKLLRFLNQLHMELQSHKNTCAKKLIEFFIDFAEADVYHLLNKDTKNLVLTWQDDEKRSLKIASDSFEAVWKACPHLRSDT